LGTLPYFRIFPKIGERPHLEEENDMAIITLLTDFGLQDYFVAAMKGVLLSINPELMLVDISHLVPPQDIFAGAFILGQSWHCFPPGSVHLAVVDPDVGTARKALAVNAGGHYFVAPDNGILTYALAGHDFEAYEITAEHYFRKPVSATFHGRDVFAPIAAWITRGIPLRQIGTPLTNPVQLKLPALTRVADALIQGCVLAVDRFGNLITNLMPGDLPQSYKILAGGREITGVHKTYAEGMPGEIVVVPGSAGYLEIAVKDGSAASTLDLKSGAPIGVVLL
jgi:S-adenosyl-L-methionine hydrolase (adenosine-forming)